MLDLRTDPEYIIIKKAITFICGGIGHIEYMVPILKMYRRFLRKYRWNFSEVYYTEDIIDRNLANMLWERDQKVPIFVKE